jgi:hypothetical protein
MNVIDFYCHALFDLGASISIMPRKIYDMLGLPPLENCYFDVPLADVAKKKSLGRINDVLIMVNNNLVPVDFPVLDIECNVIRLKHIFTPFALCFVTLRGVFMRFPELTY